MNNGAIIFDYFGFIQENKTNGTMTRDNAERFVRCIKYECAPHLYLSLVREKELPADLMNELSSIACTRRDSQWHRSLTQSDELTHVPRRIG
jgi:hypothetical protein